MNFEIVVEVERQVQDTNVPSAYLDYNTSWKMEENLTPSCLSEKGNSVINPLQILPVDLASSSSQSSDGSLGACSGFCAFHVDMEAPVSGELTPDGCREIMEGSMSSNSK